MNHLFRTILATAVTLATLFALLKITYPDETLPPTSPADDKFVFLPFISQGSISPAGAYHCDEIEYAMIWKTEVITLNTDGTHIWAYDRPGSSIVTGTWVYTPSAEVVGFTNFTWLTTTFQPPNRLWASQYITQAGFEVAISCNRLP